MSTFGRFPPRLQQAIVARLGWMSLRPVQEMAGAAILDGRNAVVLAPTAGGKTEAAVFPMLAQLMERPPRAVGALYLAPIKALLNNQEERLGTYTEMVGMDRFVWHGDATDAGRRGFLREPCELLMTTPESLEVMLLSPGVDVGSLFRDLRMVVIDEVHAFAGTDRGTHLMAVLERLVRTAGTGDVQRVGLSATVGNPPEILRWMTGSSRREGVVVDPPKQPARREILVRHGADPRAIGRMAGQVAAGRKSLMFCQSRALSEELADGMRGRGAEVFVHHSSVALSERRAAEEAFSAGSNACIVCTSTLELGIDVGDLDAVLQVDAPSTVSSFLQRMGRTGRRPGSVANTTFFCQDVEAVVQAAAIVELAREAWVEPVAPKARAWPVLAHQLMAMTLQFGGISAERAWEHLAAVPEFGGVGAADYDRLVRHMVEQGWLFSAGGLLSLGEAAEKRFGRRNFMDLYAVFSSPAHYKVVRPNGIDLGVLEQDFVDRLVEGMTSFLLGGRAWTAERVDHGQRLVVAKPAPRGAKPRWGSHLPQFLGRDVCRRMRTLIAGGSIPAYLDPSAATVMADWQEELGGRLRSAALPVQADEGGGLTVWTFAGGSINRTLELALERLTGVALTSDNFAVRCRQAPLATEDLLAALSHLREAAGSAEPLALDDAALPNYRLSKFQDCLPDDMAREVVADYLLDVDGLHDLLQASA